MMAGMLCFLCAYVKAAVVHRNLGLAGVADILARTTLIRIGSRLLYLGFVSYQGFVPDEPDDSASSSYAFRYSSL